MYQSIYQEYTYLCTQLCLGVVHRAGLLLSETRVHMYPERSSQVLVIRIYP